jgi:hypothetical protein
MKILMVFIDMFRIGLTNTFDSSKPKTEFDKQINRIGGVLYRNCYTPAPDTPRSNGCLWTSRYPSENGCDNRLKYPRYYIKPDIKDFLGILKENGYTFNFFIPEAMRRLGELPNSVTNIGNYSKDKTLEEFVENLCIEENSLTYLGFSDYHQVVTDTYAQKKYVTYTNEMCGKILKTIDDTLSFNTFDLVFFYSDHGYKQREENFDSAYLMLGDERTQIFMMVHRKNDKNLIFSDKLSSIMDIYPTILNYCNIVYEKTIRGKDLFSDNCYDWLLVEDHKTFSVDMGQSIERWAIRNKNGYACVDCALNWEADYDIKIEDKKTYKKILDELGTEFTDNVKMQSIHDSYQDFLVECPTHYDGSRRIIHKPFSQWIKDIKTRFEKGIENTIKKIIYSLNRSL